MISLESLKLIDDFLDSQDAQGLMGQCEDHMVDGYCQWCTALQELDREIESYES